MLTALAVICCSSSVKPLLAAAGHDQTSISTREEVDPAGSHVLTSFVQGTESLMINQSTGEITLSSPSLQWTIDDDGLLYIPTKVALGGRGTVAFYGCYLNNERARLFSTTTSSSVDAPIWEDTDLLEAFSEIYVDASDDGNILASLAQFPVEGDITRREVIVSKYTTNSEIPDWTYAFPMLINAGAQIKMSKDGAYIAAVLFDNNSSNIEIAFFDSGSSTPLFTDSFAGTYIRALDMTDDGNLLYINEGTMIHIYDTTTQSIIYSVSAGASFDSHTLSGDGTRFAFGGFNFVKCYEWNGSTYELQFTHNIGGSVYCARCDLSADAGTLAAAFYYYSPGLNFKVISIDATTGDTDFEADFSGTGSYQNNPAEIVTSADGSRIVYGGWGDEGNTNPEVMVFDGSATPSSSIDTRGSVFGVDISPDGIFIASGSKSVHANVSGNGGDQACLYMGGEDLILQGVPGLGDMVTFQVEGNEGERVLLAASFNEVDIPLPFGTLHVDPNQYLEIGNGVIGASGLIDFDVTVPSNPVLTGRKVVTQALITGGGSPRLTNGRVLYILP